MKRNFLTYIFLCILLLGTASSCKDDLLYSGGIIGEGESVISGTVKFKPLTPALNGTTRTPGNAIKSINSLCVLLYDEEGKLVKKYPLNQASTGTPNEGEYVLSEEERTDHKTESIGGEDKNLPPAESKTPHAEFQLTVPFGYYYIYAVANMDDLSEYEEAIKTKEGLKSISLEWKASEIAANNQMFGFFGDASTDSDAPLLTINQRAIPLHAWIRRAASKVTIAYDGSMLHENVYIYLKSVTIKDIPNQCYLGKKSAVNKDPDNPEKNFGDLIKEGESITYVEGTSYDEHWPARITKGRPYYYYYYDSVDQQNKGVSVLSTEYSDDNLDKKNEHIQKAHGEKNEALFFYENMQGEGKDKRQDHDGNGELDAPGLNNRPEDEFYKDQKPYGTYIEVKAYYVSNAEGRVGSGDITYRFMLGKNVTTDYNAERNHHYKLTLKFNKYANDVDWHIEYEEPKPGIEVPNPYYISYLYNRTMDLPIKINTGGGELISLKAKIITNNWAPNGAYTEGDGRLDYAYWYDYDVTSQKDYTAQNKGGQNQPWNGFLSLRRTTATVLTQNKSLNDPANGVVWLGEKDGKAKGNKEYYEDSKRGERDYVIEAKENIEENTEELGKFTIGNPVGTGNEQNITVHIPLYTRAKQMIISTGYTGNNPYVAYRRRATVEIQAGIRFANSEKITILKDTAEILQVRRVVNPKGIYRSWNNDTPFHVTLMRLPRENSTTFEPFTSEGPWKAEVVEGGDNMISLSRTAGETGTPIDFKVIFNSKCPNKDTSRFAIIRINYHNYTCQHLIFVRQGDAPIPLVENGAKWHTCNLVTANREAESPLDEGSLFKYGNLEDAIAASNQVNYKDPWINITPESFHVWFPHNNPNLTLANGKGLKHWADISSVIPSATTQWNLSLSDNVRIAEYNDFKALFDNKDTEQGYGVLYGDESSTTATDIRQVYGYMADGENKNTEGCGIRGCFVYNKTNSRNLFFPIGASGYGHRKRANSQTGAESQGRSGILRYAAGRVDRYPDPALGDRPLFYDLYMRSGAIYWLSDYSDATDANGNTDKTIGWDINYFTFDFNFIHKANLYNNSTDGSDACFIRCVED